MHAWMNECESCYLLQLTHLWHTEQLQTKVFDASAPSSSCGVVEQAEAQQFVHPAHMQTYM